MNQWTVADIPSLQGHVAVVTGANSGLGLETTRALASKGAHVLMACRSLEKGRAAQAIVVKQLPQATLEVAELDLASLASIRAFAANFRQVHKRLDLLFNNAGVMAIPRRETQDGFEMQFGTNHLGHFALTGLLLPTLLATPQSRIVTTTSGARLVGHIRLDDLQRKQSYGRWEAYGQSKLANLLFTLELQRRLVQAGADTISVAAHPGYAQTELQSTSMTAANSPIDRFMYTFLQPIISQSAAMGALPQLYAAITPTIHGGELIGPGGFLGMRGYPKEERKRPQDDDRQIAQQLWNSSVKLTGVDYADLQTAQDSVKERQA